MKPTKYILLLVLSFILTVNSNAQKNKSKPINSGFVFIDGVYIEPPYVIKQTDNKVLINNYIIFQIDKPQKRKRIKTVKEFPNYLPDSLNNYHSIINFKNPNTGVDFQTELISYYIYNYGEEKAGEHLSLFLNKISDIDSMYKVKPNTWMIKFHKYRTPMLYPWLYNYKMNLSYNKNQNKYFKQKVKSLTLIEENHRESLLGNKGLFFSSNILLFYSDYEDIDTIIKIINNDKLSIEKKELLLKDKISFQKDVLKEKIIINNNYKQRIKNTIIESNTSYYRDEKNRNKSVLSLKSFSPNGKNVEYYCPYTPEFNYYTQEVAILNDRLDGC